MGVKRSMAEVVAEFNKLTGNSVKRFATVEVGERRIAEIGKKPAEPVNQPKTTKIASVKPKVSAPVGIAANVSAPIKEEGHKMRITVDNQPYRSVAVAFVALGLPQKSHIKFRGVLNKAGKATFAQNDKKYLFKLNG